MPNTMQGSAATPAPTGEVAASRSRRPGAGANQRYVGLGGRATSSRRRCHPEVGIGDSAESAVAEVPVGDAHRTATAAGCSSGAASASPARGLPPVAGDASPSASEGPVPSVPCSRAGLERIGRVPKTAALRSRTQFVPQQPQRVHDRSPRRLGRRRSAGSERSSLAPSRRWSCWHSLGRTAALRPVDMRSLRRWCGA